MWREEGQSNVSPQCVVCRSQLLEAVHPGLDDCPKGKRRLQINQSMTTVEGRLLRGHVDLPYE